jgi:UDP-N-acetylmuramyl-tripeptide synthetase
MSAGFYQPLHPMALRDAISDQASEWLRRHLRDAAQLCADSRRIGEGDGFIARTGDTAEGAAYVQAAISAGAAAIVLPAADGIAEVHEEIGASPPTIRVPGLAQRMGMIASAFYGRPSMSLQLVAVTGTNGKSTTTTALAHALARAGIASAAVGTLGVAVFPAGCSAGFFPGWDERSTQGLTTPDPIDLQRLLKQLLAQGVKAVALEASSIGIVQGRLRGCAVKVAAYTNLSHDHMDVHGSMDEYAKAKSFLFESPSLDAIVVNMDDAHASIMWKTDDPHIARIAIGSRCPDNAHASIRVLASTLTGCGWELQLAGTGKASELAGPARLPVFGQHNIENAMVVAGCLLAMKIDATTIVQRLSEFRLPQGRLQMIQSAGAPWVCVDYAHSPDALARVLEALRPVVSDRGGRLICIFGCGGDRDVAKRPIMGRIASELADQAVLTSDNPRTEPPEAILDEIAGGVPAQLQHKVMRQSDRALAIAQAIARAEPNDLIVIAGKGHETTQRIGHQDIIFSDADHAQRAIDAWIQDPHHAQKVAHA